LEIKKDMEVINLIEGDKVKVFDYGNEIYELRVHKDFFIFYNKIKSFDNSK
jgi:hypothetical protein